MASSRITRYKHAALALVCINGIITMAIWMGANNIYERKFTVEPKTEYQQRGITHESLTTTKSIQTPSVSVRDILKRRVQFATTQCQEKWLDILGDRIESTVSYDNPGKMWYCSVAKAGSTYWGRIFSYLTRPEIMTSLNVHSSFEIDRILLHHKPGVRGKLIFGENWHKYADLLGNGTLKFFFTRDPYSRLWSTYLDKYYLPGYWLLQPLVLSGLCQMYVPFKTFLQHAVTSDDYHTIPASKACNPCIFKPDVIGKMETFAADTEFILRQMNYSYLRHDTIPFVDREIETITSYNFKLLDNNYKPCFTNKSLAKRLWQVFKYNGYIKESRPFPRNKKDYSVNASTQMFLQESKSHPMTRQESKHQKRRFLVKVYKGISNALIKLIQTRFEADFELFEFSKNPPS